MNAGWKACGLESKTKPSSLILTQVSCWDFSGYESALGIWFVVEKINLWFSQQGFSWHQWTCWLSSGYFCAISEFLGMLTVGLEVRLLRVEALPSLALVCRWPWRCRCTCGEMSYTLCCSGSVVAAPLPPPKLPGPWPLWPCLFMLRLCPCLCCRHTLQSGHVAVVAALPLWEPSEEEEGLSDSTRHLPLPPGLWVRCVSELSTGFASKLF